MRYLGHNLGNNLYMKINLPRPQVAEQHRIIKRGSTFIAQNLNRQSDFLDKNGNKIDPRSIMKRKQ